MPGEPHGIEITLPPPLIAVDVGNSRIKCGLFAAAVDDETDVLPLCTRFHVVKGKTPPIWKDVFASLLDEPPAGIIAGSHPDGVEKVRGSWPPGWGTPQVLASNSALPVRVNLPEPTKAGIDRLLNAVAANHVRPAGTPAIIVDSGTATTVDVLDSAGAFVGGAILPGFELSARSLHRYTALLPLIEVEELAPTVSPTIGTCTRDAVHEGLFWGQLGAVRELIARSTAALRSEHEAAVAPTIILTGGGSQVLAPFLPDARLEPQLSLQGLALAWRGI